MRALLPFLFLAFISMNAIGQTKTSDNTTIVLIYKFDGGGDSIAVRATSFDGACNVTVERRSSAGTAKKTGAMDPATFDKLMEGVSKIEAITAARITEHVPDGVDTETHHIITTLVRTKDSSKPEMYAVPDKTASDAFREWLKLLLNAVPNA
jgi:hypothetical protein